MDFKPYCRMLNLVGEGKIIGRVAQRKGSVVSGSVEDAIMDFKNFYNSYTMIRSEEYL